jgi:alpha-beta hydrolase superfamily lysophospholipase
VLSRRRNGRSAGAEGHRASKAAVCRSGCAPPGERFIGWPEPHFDAPSIKVPTLVIRGESDTLARRDDNQQLLQDLGSTVKRYVEMEQAGHMIQFETNNTTFYRATAEFLESSD